MDQDDRLFRGLLQVLQVPFEIERDGLLVVIPVGDGLDPDVGDDGIVIGCSSKEVEVEVGSDFPARQWEEKEGSRYDAPQVGLEM